MKKYCLLLLIICCCHVATASQNTATGIDFFFFKATNENPLKKIIKRIARANVYDATPVAGNHKVVSEQENNYQDLLNTATPEQLTELATDDKNAVVRLYAFRALMEKVKKAPANVYEQFMNDTTPIKVINGNSSEMKSLNSISNGFLY